MRRKWPNASFLALSVGRAIREHATPSTKCDLTLVSLAAFASALGVERGSMLHGGKALLVCTHVAFDTWATLRFEAREAERSDFFRRLVLRYPPAHGRPHPAALDILSLRDVFARFASELRLFGCVLAFGLRLRHRSMLTRVPAIIEGNGN